VYFVPQRSFTVRPQNRLIREILIFLCFRYIGEVEILFSNGIFVQFAASVIVICLTGFQMLVVLRNITMKSKF
jgi:hypothetical protein